MKYKIMITTLLAALAVPALAGTYDYAYRIPAELQIKETQSLGDLTWQQGSTPLLQIEVLSRGQPVAADTNTTVRMIIGPSATSQYYVVTSQTYTTNTSYYLQWPTVGTNSLGTNTTAQAWWYTIYFERDGHRYWTGNGDLYIEETTSTAEDGLTWQEITVQSISWSNVVGNVLENTYLAAEFATKADTNDLTAHTTNTANPHAVTAAQAGAVATNNSAYLNLLSNTATKAQGTLADSALQSEADTNALAKLTTHTNTAAMSAHSGLGSAATNSASAFATAAQGDLAASALQSESDTNAIARLNTHTNLPAMIAHSGLGTAATNAASAFATSTQGTTADTAGANATAALAGVLTQSNRIDALNVSTNTLNTSVTALKTATNSLQVQVTALSTNSGTVANINALQSATNNLNTRAGNLETFQTAQGLTNSSLQSQITANGTADVALVTYNAHVAAQASTNSGFQALLNSLGLTNSLFQGFFNSQSSTNSMFQSLLNSLASTNSLFQGFFNSQSSTNSMFQSLLNSLASTNSLFQGFFTAQASTNSGFQALHTAQAASNVVFRNLFTAQGNTNSGFESRIAARETYDTAQTATNTIFRNLHVAQAATNSAFESRIQEGETAYGWGDHADVGYLTAGTNLFSALYSADRSKLGTNLSGLTQGTYTGSLTTVSYTGVTALALGKLYAWGFTKQNAFGTSTLSIASFSLTKTSSGAISNYFVFKGTDTNLVLRLDGDGSSKSDVSSLYVKQITNGDINVANDLNIGGAVYMDGALMVNPSAHIAATGTNVHGLGTMSLAATSSYYDVSATAVLLAGYVPTNDPSLTDSRSWLELNYNLITNPPAIPSTNGLASTNWVVAQGYLTDYTETDSIATNLIAVSSNHFESAKLNTNGNAIGLTNNLTWDTAATDASAATNFIGTNTLQVQINGKVATNDARYLASLTNETYLGTITGATIAAGSADTVTITGPNAAIVWNTNAASCGGTSGDTNAVWGNISGTLANQLDLTSTVAKAASALQPAGDGSLLTGVNATNATALGGVAGTNYEKRIEGSFNSGVQTASGYGAGIKGNGNLSTEQTASGSGAEIRGTFGQNNISVASGAGASIHGTFEYSKCYAIGYGSKLFGMLVNPQVATNTGIGSIGLLNGSGNMTITNNASIVLGYGTSLENQSLLADVVRARANFIGNGAGLTNIPGDLTPAEKILATNSVQIGGAASVASLQITGGNPTNNARLSATNSMGQTGWVVPLTKRWETTTQTTNTATLSVTGIGFRPAGAKITCCIKSATIAGLCFGEVDGSGAQGSIAQYKGSANYYPFASCGLLYVGVANPQWVLTWTGWTDDGATFTRVPEAGIATNDVQINILFYP